MKKKKLKIFLCKILNFFIKKFLSFPTLNFITNSNNNFFKNLYIDFWLFLSRRKKNFYKFFFNKNQDIDFNINIDIKKRLENLNEDCLNILEKNGILIIENALSEIDQNKIIEVFNNINIQENRNLRKNETLLKYFEENQIENFKSLKNISDFFTKKVYGKVLKTSPEFHIHDALKLPEVIINGDNNLHIDRFLPNMKLYYSPFRIDERGAPFCYALGSHKINDQYVNFVKKTKLFSDADEDAKQFLSGKKEITCKANTLVVALTNGFHGRKPFLEKTNRKLLFLQYHKSYNKISLLFN